MLTTGQVYKAADLTDCGYISEITEKDVLNFEWKKYFGKSPEHTQALKKSILGDKNDQINVSSSMFASEDNFKAIETNLQKLKS